MWVSDILCGVHPETDMLTIGTLLVATELDYFYLSTTHFHRKSPWERLVGLRYSR